jgi:hypothetical protein
MGRLRSDILTAVFLHCNITIKQGFQRVFSDFFCTAHKNGAELVPDATTCAILSLATSTPIDTQGTP